MTNKSNEMEFNEVDSEMYLEKVETALNEALFSDEKVVDYIDSLITNYPEIEKAALSINTLKRNVIAGKNNPRAVTAFKGIKGSTNVSLTATSLQEERETRATIKSTAFKNQEKVDNIRRTLENLILKVQLELKENSDDNFKRIELALGDLVFEMSNVISKLNGILELLMVQQRETLSLLNEIVTIVEENQQMISNIETLSQSTFNIVNNIERTLMEVKEDVSILKKFVENYEENYGESIKKTNELMENITLIPAEVPARFGALGALPRILFGQDEILTYLNVPVQETNLLNYSAIGAVLALLLGEKIDPKNIKPSTTNYKKVIREVIDKWYLETKDDFTITEKRVNSWLDKWYEEKGESIKQDFTLYICDRIVGESYIKFDGSSTYWPTLVFKFKSAEPAVENRYAQLKIRYKENPDDITLENEKEIKAKVLKISNLTYTSGNLRCSYVAPNKWFKTTVFTNSKEDCLKLLSSIVPLSKTPFEANNVSYTQAANRDTPSRRTKFFGNLPLNRKTDREPLLMKLSSVYLQINGVGTLIKIF